MPTPANTPRRTLLLTGASRGIGHATVIRFSSAGWRVITCSRHPFPEDCPWDAGPEDHIQVDLADHAGTTRAIAEIRERLEGGASHALVNSIGPGELDTSTLSPGTEKIVEQQIPLHRLGTPDEVAKIIYVLCTETSSYVNGAEIHINGGQHV